MIIASYRALELAVKHKSHVDTVIWYRKADLAINKQEETHALYLQFAQEVSDLNLRFSLWKRRFWCSMCNGHGRLDHGEKGNTVGA